MLKKSGCQTGEARIEGSHFVEFRLFHKAHPNILLNEQKMQISPTQFFHQCQKTSDLGSSIFLEILSSSKDIQKGQEQKDCAIFTDFSYKKQRSMGIFMHACYQSASPAPVAVFFSSKILAYLANFGYFVANVRIFLYTFTGLNSLVVYQN